VILSVCTLYDYLTTEISFYSLFIYSFFCGLDMHFARVTYLSDVTPKSKSPKLRSPTIGRRRGPLPPAPVPNTRRRDRVFN
jgi:hypothetical protein